MKRSAFFNAASLLLGLGAALFSSAGCATLTNVPTTHIVMVNGRGNPVDHTGPETPLDRTVGRYENLLSAIHNAPDELRGRVHIKAFGAGRDVRTPQKHGDFTSHLKFWKSECWWSPGADYPPDCYDQ